MVGINLFGFRKFELLRGEGEGGGGGEGPGQGMSPGQAQAMGGGYQGGDSVGDPSGADPGFAPDAQFSDEDVGLGAVSANTQNFDVSPAQQMAELGAISDSSIGAGADVSGNSYFDAIETDPDKLADQVAFESVSSNVPDVIGPNSPLSNEDAAIAVEVQNELSDPFSNNIDFNTASSIADDTEVGTISLDDAFVEQYNDPNLSSTLDSGVSIPDVSALYGGVVTPEMMSTPSQVAEDALASEALSLDQGITGMLGGDSVSPVDFTATDAVTTDLGINPAALAAATGIVGAGISDPAETGVQDPSGITVDTGLTGDLEALSTSPVGIVDPGLTAVADQDAGMGAAIAANDGFNATVGNPVTGASANVADLGFDAVGTGTDFNAAALDAMLGDDAVSTVDSLSVAQDPSEVTDTTFNPTAFEEMTGLDITGANANIANNANQTGLPELSAMTAPFVSSSGYPSIDNFAAINQGIIDDNANTSGVTADTLYGTSLVTGLPTTAMSPIEAQAMTGGSTTTTNNTGMNLAQQTDNVEATNQAEAMDVLGAQIGAGNLTGNEDIDQVNIELAKQGVQIDTSGLPGLLGTGVNAINQNYQLNQNQDILSQLAQGSNFQDDGILGTGIGAVTGVNTYTPAYNAQGQIVGSVATDAAGNAVGGGAGITTNVVGGLGAMDDVYSDAAGTNLYGDVNEAVGDFKDMVASSQSSDEGPPQDVTSVDSNGCVIGAEFFDGQKCSPIGSTVTGDATGGGTGGAFTPYNYQPGQGTMLRPDFSDAFTSNVQFNTLNPNASNMNFLKPAVNPYGNFAGGGIVPMMRNNSVR